MTTFRFLLLGFLLTVATLASHLLNRGFLAAILRKASEVLIDRSMIDAEVARAREEGYRDGKQEGERCRKSDHLTGEQNLRMLKERVEAFERVSGINIDDGWSGDKIGEAVNVVLAGGLGRARHHLESLHHSAKLILRMTEGLLKENGSDEVGQAGGDTRP